MDIDAFAAKTSINTEDIPDLFSKLAIGAYKRYTQTGTRDDISEAIDWAKQGIDLANDSNPLLAQWLDNLGVFLERRYKRMGEMRDLEEAIETARQAVKLTPDDHPDQAARLNNLGVLVETRYKRTGESRDLEEAIEAARQAVKSMPDDHPDRAAMLSNLGNKLQSWYERTGEMRDLEEAIDIARQAVESTPDNHPNLAVWLNNLGTKLASRYGRTGEMKDLEEAIEIARQAINSMPDGHPNLSGMLNALGSNLGERYERTGEMKDLEEAIEIARRAVELTPDDHLDLAYRLSNLGNKLRLRYERKGEMRDLEQAIKTARQAVESTPDNHPELPTCLNNLGDKLRLRYERTGEMRDLEEAIKRARQAVKSTPDDHPSLAVWLNNLGLFLECRYKRTGEMRDLEEAIETARQAVKLTPDDHPSLAVWLNSIGVLLGHRYERTGEMRDLEEAINTARQAVKSTPNDHPSLAVWLNNLGIKLGRWYERTGEMKDLEEAIEIARRAVELTPDDHPNLAAWLNNLGIKLGRWYERTGEMRDLEEAIQTARQAVELTPNDHPSLAGWLSNLGNNLERRYKRTGEMKDLEEAIEIARRAVELTPDDHPDLAGRLNALGLFLGLRYERTGETKDLEDASTYLLEAWSCLNAVPFHRIKAAATCLVLLAAQNRVGEGIDLGKRILDLLPSVHTRTLDRNDQQFVVSTFAGVASNLCSFLLAENRSSEALEHLEQGRAIIISQLLDDRSDLSSLRQDHSQLATRYQSLVDEVNTPTCQTTPDVVEALLRKRRQEAAAELDRCLNEIRCVPGHERFMLGQTVAEMQACISEGSIVIINITDFQSDAIIISSKSLRTILLPELSASKARSWASKDWSTNKRSEQRRKNDEFLEYLSWLWHACVKHIVVVISASQTHPSEGLPRVWWIGSGLASSMPFHAAGVHRRGSKENAYCRMISSYTPSIKALTYAQTQAKRAQNTLEAQDLSAIQKQLSRGLPWARRIGSGLASSMLFHAAGRHLGGLAKNAYGRIISFFTPLVKALAYAQNLTKPAQETLVAQDTNRMLIATMPTSPIGPGDKKAPKKLPGVEEEMREILNLTRSHMHTIALTHPSADQVLEVLKTCRIAHFACHGTSDIFDPSNSGLILQKSTGPDETLMQDRLTVQRVSDLRLRYAQIAYLSACSTAENKTARLSDEVIHVVSGFQVAGFPHVVGCLWPAGDSECVKVAKRFYSLVLQRHQAVISNEVASVVQEAVMAVREGDLDMPLNWAQFVHYGA